MSKLKSIDDLKPDPGNPRAIEEPAAAGLRMSLQSFGDVGGIVFNEQTGELVSGHQRVEQLRKVGATLEPGDPPHLVLGDYRWPVRVVDWSRERQRTANLAANNPATSGEFTPEVGDILGELEGLVEEDLFAGLRLDSLVVNVPTPEIGSGEIEDRGELSRFAVFCPHDVESEIRKSIENSLKAHGGYIIRCGDENCNVSVRKLDTNAWAERRGKLGKAKVSTRGNQDSELPDGEGG